MAIPEDGAISMLPDTSSKNVDAIQMNIFCICTNNIARTQS